MRKKLLSLLLALVMCLGLCGGAAAAQAEPEIDVTWLEPYVSTPASYVPELDWVTLNAPPGGIVLNASTGEVIEQFNRVSEFHNGRAMVEIYNAEADNKVSCGYIDATGKVVIPVEYGYATDFDGGLAFVRDRQARRYVCIDTSGQTVFTLPADCGDTYGFSEGLAAVGSYSDDSPSLKWGYVDRTGQMVIQAEYNQVRLFSEGLAAVAARDEEGMLKWGFIDKTGKVVVPLKYDFAWSFSDGLARVRLIDREAGTVKYGFIDQTGKEVVPVEYYYAEDFSEGLAMVSQEDENHHASNGYIDTTGQVVIPLQYDSAGSFAGGLAQVMIFTTSRPQQRQNGFIDRTGQVVVPMTQDYSDAGMVPGGALCWVAQRSNLAHEEYTGVFKNPYYTAPEPEPDPGPISTPLAFASTQNILVDGKPVEFQAYALKDENGNDTNYVKLRDVAYVLNGSAAQFSVGWDQAAGSISAVSGEAYKPNGTEMSTPFSGNRSYKVSDSPLFINGQPASLEAIVLTDDAGNGYTYFKLRDLGTALGFTVGWSEEKGIFIETK